MTEPAPQLPPEVSAAIDAAVDRAIQRVFGHPGHDQTDPAMTPLDVQCATLHEFYVALTRAGFGAQEALYYLSLKS